MKSITTKRGDALLVDDDDECVLSLNWRSRPSDAGVTYAETGRHNRGTYAMAHHLIAERAGLVIGPCQKIDHINGDGMDNRRCNLRVATLSENAANRRRFSNNKCGYKGVYLKSRGKKSWVAAIGHHGKIHYLGVFQNIIDAVIAYDRAAIEIYGEFARTNYPRFACGVFT